MIAAMLLSFAVSARAVTAKPVQKLDFRFKSEGRVYHVFQAIEPGKDLQIDAPVASDDKSSSIVLHLRASLQDADATGRATLLYQAVVKGAGDALLVRSEGSVYLVPGTYSEIGVCADWSVNLGLWNGQRPMMRVGTGDDQFVFSMRQGANNQKCKVHAKPGGKAAIRAEMTGPDGRPQVFSFKVSPGAEPKMGGKYDVAYDAYFPGFAMSGISALAVRQSTTLKQNGRSLNIWMGRDD